MGWLLLILLIIVAILGIAFFRNCNQDYRIGSGLFKSSEYNLEDKDELSDKDYYKEDGMLD